MGKLTSALLPFLSLAVLLGGCSSGPDMKEGEWEISSETGMQGIPIKIPSVSYTQCLTKDDFIPHNKKQAENNCTIIEQDTDNDTVIWKISCRDGTLETMSEGMITYSGVLFSGKIDITMTGGPVSMNATSTITGKYLGPCK